MPYTDTQLADRITALESILWLMESHYAMVKAGRVGSCIQYEREPGKDGPAKWQPPVQEEREGWPVNETLRWFARARATNRRYRLGDVAWALETLEGLYPAQAAAVKARWCEIPPPNWYEPDGGDWLAYLGLRFMAKAIPGEIPHYDGERPKTREELAAYLIREEGITSPTVLAERLGCTYRHAKRLKRAVVIRRERTRSAGG